MDPLTETKSVTSDGKNLNWKNLSERLEIHLEAHRVQMELDGYNPKTIRLSQSSLKVLKARGADLLMPDSVKAVIARQQWSGNRTRNVCNAYTSFLRYLNLSWTPPRYTIIRKVPFIPTEQEIDELVAGSPNPLATFLQLLKETAMRRGEAIKIPWIDVDLERRVINCNYPEKGSNPRSFPALSGKLLNMLNNLPKENDTLFGNATENLLKNQLCRARARLAFKLGNPRIKEIHFHTLRHWKATMLYHYAKDIMIVKEFLGHRTIDNTLLYIQIEKSLFANLPDDKFIIRAVHSIEEATELGEVGFEPFMVIQGVQLMRKRK